jgi:hypothetical protein
MWHKAHTFAIYVSGDVIDLFQVRPGNLFKTGLVARRRLYRVDCMCYSYNIQRLGEKPEKLFDMADCDSTFRHIQFLHQHFAMALHEHIPPPQNHEYMYSTLSG